MDYSVTKAELTNDEKKEFFYINKGQVNTKRDSKGGQVFKATLRLDTKQLECHMNTYDFAAYIAEVGGVMKIL